MSHPPEAFMIYKEELKKAKLEQERLRKEYEAQIDNLSEDMAVLKEKISSQEEMMKTALNYAMDLERKLKTFKDQIDLNEEKKGFGYY